MSQFLLYGVVTVGAFLLMEAVAWATHRWVMHGWGWGWHRDHHEPHDRALERNDLYAIVFGLLTIGLFWIGAQPGLRVVWFFALGVTFYGLTYAFVHDGLVHRRLPVRWIPKTGYFKRLVQAHRLHHATHGKDGAVSFGFLYAPDVRRLKAKLKASHAGLDVDRVAG